MKLLLIALFFLSGKLMAQSCDCGLINVKFKWPKQAEENSVYGTVKISYYLTDSCLITNPVLTQTLGYGLDEEVLRIFNQMAEHWNKCQGKCKPCNCIGEQKAYSARFINPEFETFINNVIVWIKCFMIRFKIL